MPGVAGGAAVESRRAISAMNSWIMPVLAGGRLPGLDSGGCLSVGAALELGDGDGADGQRGHDGTVCRAIAR